MVNVAVFNLKDLIKYLLKFAIIVLIITIVAKFYKYLGQVPFTKSIEKTIPAIVYINTDTEENVNKIEELNNNSWVERILNTHLAMKNNILIKDVEEPKIAENKDPESEPEELGKVQTGVDTQVIMDNNIATNYTNIYKSVEIKNSSKYTLTEEILNPDIQITDKKDIIIYHTHTCESYTPSEKYQYTMTGSYRTTDLNYSVSRVGDELEKYLKDKRI